ncbi:hypothetical protein KIPB_015276 [Kipferlia bialata]|uniref:Uncharacterized protein n=1 Tax=Kipferlia bialata TaxID=797122 RepID=A0A9K3GQX3_9EUKA|nr:hypothetical protein KIPB_015276 [Kipferlia bialata]|eukprot:g15276.t1
MGRLILLFSDEWVHVLDTVSGDCATIAEWRRRETEHMCDMAIIKLGTRILKLNLGKGIAFVRDDGPVSGLYTLNPALLYPSEEMGWGRVLEWDKDRRGRLGLPGVESTDEEEEDLSDDNSEEYSEALTSEDESTDEAEGESSDDGSYSEDESDE